MASEGIYSFAHAFGVSYHTIALEDGRIGSPVFPCFLLSKRELPCFKTHMQCNHRILSMLATQVCIGKSMSFDNLRNRARLMTVA